MEQRYFVSYILVPSIAHDRQYRQYAVFTTDDLETILMNIIPTRRRTGLGKIKSQIQEYREWRRVSFGKAEHAGIIKDVVIRKLPQRDWEVITKYL